MVKTIKFSASLGVIAGYGHGNEEGSKRNFFAKLFGKKKSETAKSETAIAGEAWQKAAAAVMSATGTYVGVVITPARVAYHTDWGCPVGGEKAVSITGECNPEYTDLAAYKAAVVETLRQAALALGQSTTQLTFSEVELEYLDFRPKEDIK